jgi:parallel beta-helix repeat protein
MLHLLLSLDFGTESTVSLENIIVDNIAGNNKQSGFLLWISESNNLKDNILIENGNSGVYLLSSDSNILNINSLSNNSNGISIGDSSNNLVTSNTFSSNNEYGLFYFYSNLNKNNTIKENIFLNNKKGDDNLPSSSIPIYILILLAGAGLAYYLQKRSLLKKALISLGILIIISLIAIVAWYFPFESGLSGNNVEITNFSWYNSSKINETHTQVTLSTDINYRNKQAYEYSFAENSQTDVIPTRIQILSREYKPYEDEEIPYTLLYEEEIILTYRKPFKYETTLDLENNMEYDIQTIIVFEREFDYPNPYGEELRWEQLGGWQQLIST